MSVQSELNLTAMLALLALSSSFTPLVQPVAPSRASPAMMSEGMGRRELVSKVLGGAALAAAAAPAFAEIDYAGVGYLGGSSQIDVNNANIRVYQKLPGLYPNAAGKIVSKGPYKSKEDLYTKGGFTAPELAAVKKYESKYLFLEPRPEYVIDIINNGLYR